MRIATAAVNWNNSDVPDYRPWTPWPRMMDEFAAAGYAACEWGANMPTDPAELDGALHDRGLTLIGAFVGLLLRDPELVEAELERAVGMARFLSAAGATHLIAAEAGDDRRRSEAGHVDPAGGLSEAQWASLCSGLDELGRRLAPLGMRVVFHHHAGTYVETPTEVARLLDGTDPEHVAWCFDMGHLVYGGGDPLAMLARFGDRVDHVHVKDLDARILAEARAGSWGFGDALRRFIFPPLGEGMVGIPAVIEALRAGGYDGWLVVEQDTTPGDPLVTARRNHDYLEGLLRG